MSRFLATLKYKNNTEKIESSEKNFEKLVVDRIKSNEFLDGLTYVRLYKCELTEFPDFLPIGLEQINLNSNNITEIPDLTRFTRLETFDISNNKVTKIGKLPNGLLNLYFSYNQVSVFPECGDSLNWIYCGCNQLVDISNIPKNILILSICYNRLTRESLMRINSKIKDFYIQHNSIDVIDLKHISVLRLTFGGPSIYEIRSLPSNVEYIRLTDSINIFRFPKLSGDVKEFYLYSNTVLKEFPIFNNDYSVSARFVVSRFGNIFRVGGIKSHKECLKRYKECLIRLYLFKWSEKAGFPRDLLRLLFSAYM